MPSILRCLTALGLTSLAVASPAPQDPIDQDQNPDPFDDSHDCSANTAGSGPSPDNDTPADFLAYQPFADSARNATTPLGYHASFVNQNATVWNNVTFLDFDELTSYNTDLCKFMTNLTRLRILAGAIFIVLVHSLIPPFQAPTSATRSMCVMPSLSTMNVIPCRVCISFLL